MKDLIMIQTWRTSPAYSLAVKMVAWNTNKYFMRVLLVKYLKYYNFNTNR